MSLASTSSPPTPNAQAPAFRNSAVYFYSITGQRVSQIHCEFTYDATRSGPPVCLVTSANVYFGGKLLRSNGVAVATDRLGSVRANANGERMSYLPYGQERTSTAEGREKFGTYFRDGAGQDYADQRYYGQAGAFWTPDPGGIATASLLDPTGWNRYAYVNGDPVNFNDSNGLFGNAVGSCGSDGGQALCDIDNGNGGAAGPVNGPPVGGGGCILDGVTTDCSIIRNLALGDGVLYFGPAAVAIPLGSGLGTLVRVGSGVCEVIAVAAGGAAIGAAIGWSAGKLANIYFARKADVRQFADAGKQVGREAGCRPPNNADFNTVHEIIKDQKGPDGKVPYRCPP